MSDEFTSEWTAYDARIIEMPAMSEWQCELFGGGPLGIVWRPAKGDVPNAFWRLMQYLVFGNRWRKDSPNA